MVASVTKTNKVYRLNAYMLFYFAKKYATSVKVKDLTRTPILKYN